MRYGRKYGRNWICYYFVFKKNIVKLLSNVTSSPSHRQAGVSMTNIQSTLRTAPNFCKNVSLAVLFGSDSNSYTIHTQSYLCIYTYSLQYRDAGRAKKMKKMDSSKCRVPRKSFRVPLVRHPWNNISRPHSF